MYAEQAKKEFIDVSQVKEANREGIFQNKAQSRWEYWEGGSIVASKSFADIHSKGALESWLDKIAEGGDQ